MGTLAAIGRYLLIPLWCAVLGATLTYAFLRGMSPEAFAATLTALVSAVLVYYAAQSAIAARESVSAMEESVQAAKASAEATKQSAQATSDGVGKQDEQYRATVTIGILNQFNQTVIPVTDTIAITPAVAQSQLVAFSEKLPELRALRDQFEQGSTEPQHEQYRAIVSSISVLINFYMVAMQLLRRDLLDVPLFMNTFAKTFLAVIGPLRTVNAETGTVSSTVIDRLNPFQEMCEAWRLREQA